MLGHQTPPDAAAGTVASRRMRAPTGRQAERQLVDELLCELRQLRETSSAAAVAAQSALNGVLAVETIVIPAGGVVSRQYRTQVGSVVVANHGTATVTVSSSPQGPGAPSSGQGLHPVSKSTAVSIPIGSHTVTLYGTADDVVGLQVYTGLVQPMSGSC